MIQAFIDLVAQNAREGMVVAEVGVWDGDSTQAWLPIVVKHHGKAILVDNFMGNPTATGPHAHTHVFRSDVLAELHGRIVSIGEAMGVEMRGTHVIVEDSVKAAAQIPDASVDIVFLDADHRYAQTSANMAAWLPKVKPGGILAGHDYDQGHEPNPEFFEMDTKDGVHHGVIQAVNELKTPVQFLGDTCWMTRKPTC